MKTRIVKDLVQELTQRPLPPDAPVSIRPYKEGYQLLVYDEPIYYLPKEGSTL